MTPRKTLVLFDIAAEFEGEVDQTLLDRAVQEAILEGSAGRFGDVGSTPSIIEVSVRVTDEAEMRRLNREYRGVDRPTDVLSFSFLDQQEGPAISYPPGWPVALGEIAVSHPRAKLQAAELGHSIEMELAWLVIHGGLQLLGYTHDTDEEAEHMEDLEQRALRSLGFRKG